MAIWHEIGGGNKTKLKCGFSRAPIRTYVCSFIVGAVILSHYYKLPSVAFCRVFRGMWTSYIDRRRCHWQKPLAHKLQQICIRYEKIKHIPVLWHTPSQLWTLHNATTSSYCCCCPAGKRPTQTDKCNFVKFFSHHCCISINVLTLTISFRLFPLWWLPGWLTDWLAVFDTWQLTTN